MKLKNIMWIISGVVAIVSMAAGIALLVDRYFLNKCDNTGDYIECDCESEEAE